jgi:hypothetical protein
MPRFEWCDSTSKLFLNSMEDKQVVSHHWRSLFLSNFVLFCIFVLMHLPICGKIMMQIVISLEVYGVKSILGIQYGFKGFVDNNHPPIMVSFPKCFMIKKNVWCIMIKITFIFKPCKFLFWLGVGGVCEVGIVDSKTCANHQHVRR